MWKKGISVDFIYFALQRFLTQSVLWCRSDENKSIFHIASNSDLRATFSVLVFLLNHMQYKEFGWS